MQRVWQRTLLPVLAAALAAVVLTGCPAAARRPGEPAAPGYGALKDLNGELARAAAAEPGTGQTAAVVLGNAALLAIGLPDPAAVPGAAPGAGAVHNRVATAVMQRFPFITDVRFVTDPAQARTLAALAAQVRAGRSVVPDLPQLAAMAATATAATPLVPMPAGPPQSGAQPMGTRTTTPAGQGPLAPTPGRAP